ncbi:MAG: alpha/beta hydrolase [Nocardioidaceae bacterium]
MGIRADMTAYVLQKSAPFTVDYGKSLYFSGADLPGPTRISVPTRHGRVRCDVYRPQDDGETPPVYVHLHGGAFVMRYPKMDDFFARFVAEECRAVVVNVDYDVAPQARYPVAQQQAHDVAAWVAGHGFEFGADGDRVAVGGFSAGGNLAASAALQARDLGSFSPVLQVLGVPSLDVAAGLDTKTSPIPSPMITPSLLRLVRSTYFRDETTRADAYASPLLAPDVGGLAPAVVVTAEYDVLRAEGDAYAARLSDAGVDVVHRVVTGRDHYFLDGDRVRARGTLDLVAHRLREAFGTTY